MAEILPENEEDITLPLGWKKKESKSQPGRYYYISPSGQTQWVRPLIRANTSLEYNWQDEIEIEFGVGRLGVALHEVDQNKDVLFPHFQAEVEKLPKLPNGHPGPAEVYNYSVKPEKRLKIGMRLTAINGEPLTGCTYTEVVEKLKRASRPLKIKFADVMKGLLDDEMEDGSEDNSDDGLVDKKNYENKNELNENNKDIIVPKKKKKKKKDFKNNNDLIQKDNLNFQYKMLLVISELKNETWKIEHENLSQQRQIEKKKWNILKEQYNKLSEEYSILKKEYKKLIRNETELKENIDQLKKQEKGEIPSSESVRATELSNRNLQLTRDIEKMAIENKTLKKERLTLQKNVEELEPLCQTDIRLLGSLLPDEIKNENNDNNEIKELLLEGIDLNASPAIQLKQVDDRIHLLNKELYSEDNRINLLQKELSQLNYQLTIIDK